MTADKTSWNYFTLESICKAKCGLCGVIIRPTINKQKPLSDHLCINDTKHQDCASIEDSAYESINWDEFYDTMTVENMLNPKVKCTRCDHVMSIQAGTDTHKKSLIHAVPEMKEHLKDKHQIDERTRIQMKSLNEWIEDKAGDYCNITKSKAIKLYTCTLCDNNDNEIRTKNAIMFLKHLSDKHRYNIRNFPWDELPEQFLFSTPRNEDVDINLQDSSLVFSLTDFFDISTDRSRQRGSISEIERSDRSNQPPSDTRDILNISQDSQQQSGKRKSDTQIEESPYKRKKSRKMQN